MSSFFFLIWLTFCAEKQMCQQHLDRFASFFIYPSLPFHIDGELLLHSKQETFEEFLAEINDKFSTDKYDLIKNNCNHFVEECCQFLTGQGLPKYIID